MQIKSGTRRILQGIPSIRFTRKLASRRLIGPRASRLPFAALHVAALLCLTLAPPLQRRQRRLADHDTDRLPSCYSPTRPYHYLHHHTPSRTNTVHHTQLITPTKSSQAMSRNSRLAPEVNRSVSTAIPPPIFAVRNTRLTTPPERSLSRTSATPSAPKNYSTYSASSAQSGMRTLSQEAPPCDATAPTIHPTNTHSQTNPPGHRNQHQGLRLRRL